MAQIGEKTVRIDNKTQKLASLAKQTDVARRLQTMPGIGPMTAVAVEAFAPTMENFKSGRNFAAWLGLVPRQFSSGGKERLGKVSRAGQVDIRRLLIIGAMARVNWASRKATSTDPWMVRMLGRKPRMLVAIALANKMARMIWAMLTRQEDYRNPGLPAAA
ncbi:transposase [Rhizobium sp. BK512]|nr:transposase [Rhizobium sp. BK512]